MAASPALPPGLASAVRAQEADHRGISLKAASPWLAHCAALCGAGDSGSTEPSWYYKGTDTLLHGPYDAETMRAWFDAGHLDEDLQIRREYLICWKTYWKEKLDQL